MSQLKSLPLSLLNFVHCIFAEIMNLVYKHLWGQIKWSIVDEAVL